MANEGNSHKDKAHPEAEGTPRECDDVIGRKGKLVTFYKNGDAFFKVSYWTVSIESKLEVYLQIYRINKYSKIKFGKSISVLICWSVCMYVRMYAHIYSVIPFTNI